jgi:hypothetical protein
MREYAHNEVAQSDAYPARALLRRLGIDWTFELFIALEKRRRRGNSGAGQLAEVGNDMDMQHRAVPRGLFQLGERQG